MKKLMLSWLVLLMVYQSVAQTPQINQINIPSFTVKNILPGNIDNWLTTPGALLMTAQKVPGSRVLEPRMVIQIRSNGALICGNSPANPRPVDPFDVRTFNTADLVGMLGNCHELKEGSYTICVQFYNIDKIAISREVCKDFTVEATVTDYSPPVLISPTNEKTFSVDELQRPVTFRWTPLVPKPKEPVTYRLKVWQLMQGQNSTTAMRSNQPIVTKDVDNINQVVVNGVITGPCRPPYLCEFIWSVQALNRNGKPLGNNNGLSEPYTFKATENNQPGDCQPPALMSPANSKSFSLAEAQRSITFRWTPLVPKPRDPVTYRLKVWQLMQGQNGTQAMRSNQPIVTKDVDNISEVTVNGIYTGPCKPPYLCDFIWQVQAINHDGTPAGCKEGLSEPFSFKVEAGAANGQCQPPVLMSPANSKSFKPAEALQSITFRWTPLVPKPQEPVTYRLKVWQLMQGQNSTEAMRSNQPIVTKDVDNVNEITVNGIYTGPCRPPYLCEFIWQVQALNRQGNPVGCKGGTSEPFSFKVESNGTIGDCQPPALSAPVNNKNFTQAEAQQSITFRWTPLVPKPRDPVTYRLKVWQLMQGQNGTQAMRSNQPIVTKDVDNISEATVSGIYTGPCRPPYLCEFIWQVQAIYRDGSPAGCKEGYSEPFSFKVESNGTNGDCQPPALSAPANNKNFTTAEAQQSITFHWTPLVPKPRDPVTYRLKVWQLMQGQNGTQAMRSNQPIVTKDVDNVTEISVSGIYTGPCRPPYLCEFIWQVQALNRDGTPAGCKEGTSETFSFKVESNAANGDCQPPVLTAPANNKSYKVSDAGQPITFRWTPVVPKPRDPVTYRLKVWQLMQGQSGSQAMRSNQPIVTKDVDNVSEITVSGIYTGPCKPPYLCEFIWQVQALNRDGKPVGCKEGMSEPFSFKMQNNIDIEIDSLKVGCCEKGKQSIYISVKNNLANPVKITAISYKINGAGAAIPLTPVTPTLWVNIPGNGSQVFTSSVDCMDNASWLKFLVDAEDVADPDNKETEVASDTLHCICNACDSMKIDINQKDSIKLVGNNLVLNNTINVSPKPVKSVNAELVYFEYVPESEDCMLCNKDPKTFGNFISAETGIVSPTIPAPHTVNWNIGSVGAQVITNQAINFTISMPPTVKCCAAQVRWCIRYVITFADCTVCNKLVCYTYNKKCDCK